jgi:DNA polymerase-4
LRRCLRTQADELAAKLKASHLGAHTIQVKVRYSDFTTLTRQITFEEPVTEPEEIYRLACHLMARDKLARRPLRLLGLGLTGLGEPTVRQLELPLKRPR